MIFPVSNHRAFLLFVYAAFARGLSSSALTSSASIGSKAQQQGDFWQIGSTFSYQKGRPMPPKIQEALETNTHPDESQDELGNGIFVTSDWRQAWWTYQSPPEDPTLIDDFDGFACYDIDEIDGTLPDDLHGTLYRNGPGKFGVNGQRVAHVLDADGLVLQVTIPPPSATEPRTVRFQSRFIETKAFQQERSANQFLVRGTFGTGPMGASAGAGVNQDPVEPSLVTKVMKRAFQLDIKNTANTQVVAFGGKLLTLFEAGLPYRLDPITLQTLEEYDMGGTLPRGKMAVSLKDADTLPDFMGGAAHTAHPNICPRTGHLVGWSWTQLANDGSLKVTITEWSPVDFSPVASATYIIPNCELAPHDMAMTENYIVLKVNALEMNRLDFLSGLKGPAASLKMDGRANVKGWILPRPTSTVECKEPIVVDIPPCFSIHFSHAYECPITGNIVSIFSGWPASDSKDFLGAWGGFAPIFNQIPQTFIWRLELDPRTQSTVDLSIAPGCRNVCAEHPVVHPNFVTKRVLNSYAVASNLVGDSTAPCGYVRLRVEDGSITPLAVGDRNQDVDSYWFGSRYFAGEPLVVPKTGGDLNDEDDAYLLGMVQDSVRNRSFVAIFDLKRPLTAGPVCRLWLKSAVPHGLHGCFDPGSDATTSYFC
jgi:all-trans-8'-apo-beta-carotenal 15,15'-oxygenase